jgi:hypothetical protein
MSYPPCVWGEGPRPHYPEHVRGTLAPGPGRMGARICTHPKIEAKLGRCPPVTESLCEGCEYREEEQRTEGQT